MSNKSCKTLSQEEEIWHDIFARLPVKSLVRFMCVSKPWKRFIGSSYFVSMHLSNARKKGPSYLFVHHQVDSRNERKDRYSLFCKETFERYLEFRHPLETKKPTEIYGSSNGLLCISDSKLCLLSQVCIWNPSICKITTLPLISIPRKDLKTYRIALSFGFHPQLNDYKAVRMLHFRQNMVHYCIVHVYTLSTGSWKMIDVVPDSLKSRWHYRECEFVNGVAYWLILCGSVLKIVSFDTGSESFEEVVVPNSISVKGNVCFKAYKESVCLLKVYLGSDRIKQHVDLWVLQEQTLKNLGNFVMHRDPGISRCPLCFFTENQLLVEETDYADQRVHLALFNLESEQVDRIGIKWVRSSCYVSTYVESLIGI